MRIDHLSRSFEDGKVTLSALVDGRVLWFRFQAALPLADEIQLSAAPFAVAMLLVAMQRREDIWIDATLSPRILAGLQLYQERYNAWFPNRFHRIQIHSQSIKVVERAEGTPLRTACAFSGGVDSFYSFLELSSLPITDALFMAGFDMPLNLTDSISELTRSYTELMSKAGVRFWVGSTNVRHFVNTVDWTNSHGQALAASALFFEAIWDSFVIPSSYVQSSHPRWGTHPELDPLLSTEQMRFVHHGAELDRLGKLKRILQSPQAPESYSRLRVCWIQDIGLRNCGRCEKCLRTMTALDLLGALPRYTTFGTKRVPIMRLLALPQRAEQSRIFTRELIRAALSRGRLGIAAALSLSLLMRLLRRASAVRNERRLRRSS